MKFLTLAVLIISGCASSGAAIGSALVNTAVAASVAGVRRANGECYTPCTPGNVCNPETGLCDAMPCRGECMQNERCAMTLTGEKCVPLNPGPTP